MNRELVTAGFLSAVLGLAVPSLGQDVLAEHKIRALKSLDRLAIVIRPGGTLSAADSTRVKEWSDRLEVILSRDLPTLGRVKSDKDARAWLELSLVTSEHGAALDLTLYRWTRVVDSGEVIFSKVWTDSQYTFGSAPDGAIKRMLDKVVTSFAADYLRANR